MQDVNNIPMNNKFAVVIISCDAYKDAWNTFLLCFEKFWPNFSGRKYFITNTENIKDSDFIVIKTGEEKSWSAKVRTALKSIDEQFLIVLLEDYFLCKKVFDADIFKAENFVLDKNADYLCLMPYKYMIRYDSNYSLISSKNLYGKILQPSIWKKTYLESCLFDDDFSAWEFERRQKKSSVLRIAGKDYCTKKKVLGFKNGILQGKWYGPSVKHIKKIGINVDTKYRAFLPRFEIFKRRIKLFAQAVFPSCFLKIMKRILSKIGFKFVTKD